MEARQQTSGATMQPMSLFRSYHGYVVPSTHPLSGVVQEFYQLDTVDFPYCQGRFLPDACTDMFFFISDDEESLNWESSDLVVGSPIKLSEYPMNSGDKLFGIRFVPGAFALICRVPASEVLGEFIPAHEIVHKYNRCHEKLCGKKTFEERVSICSQYVSRLIWEQNNEEPEFVRQIVKDLFNSKGQAHVGEIVKRSGYSERYVREVFKRYVGLSPKSVEEIARLQASIGLYLKNPKLSAEAVAYESGYYDYSHMNKSYKALLMDTPRAFLQSLPLLEA